MDFKPMKDFMDRLTSELVPGNNISIYTDNKVSMFYAHHMLNPQETFYLPRLRNILYTCITR